MIAARVYFYEHCYVRPRVSSNIVMSISNLGCAQDDALHSDVVAGFGARRGEWSPAVSVLDTSREGTAARPSRVSVLRHERVSAAPR